MSKVSRRQFLSTAAGATAVTAFPHVWVRPAWAQTKDKIKAVYAKHV